MGSATEERAVLEDLLRAEDWDAIAVLADRQYEQGRLSDYRKTLRAVDERGIGWAAHNLGLLAEEEATDEEAERWYRRAMDLGFDDAALNLALLLEGRGDISGAQALYEREAAKGDISALNNLGLLLASAGNAEGAEALLRKAYMSDASYGWQLGSLMVEQSRLAEATNCFRAAVRTGERRAARDLAAITDPERETEVRELYRQAIAANAVGAVSDFAEYLIRRGHLEEAETLLRAAVANGDAYAPLTLARLLWEDPRRHAESWAFYEMAKSQGDDISREAPYILGAHSREGGTPTG